MASENEKQRRNEKREYNRRVRELVNFVRRRDRRVLERERQAEEEREKKMREQEEMRRQREKEKKERAMNYVDPEWAIPDELPVEEGASDGEQEGPDRTQDSEQEASERFECIACDKVFRSESQLRNHERSRKHRERLKALEKHLLEEEIAATGEAQGVEVPTTTSHSLAFSDDDQTSQKCAPLKLFFFWRFISVDPFPCCSQGGKSKKKKKKKKQKNKAEEGNGEESQMAGNACSTAEPKPEASEETGGTEKDHPMPSGTASHSEQEQSGQEQESSSLSHGKKGKASKRRAKEKKEDKKESRLTCQVCRQAFPSRSQLFKHLRSEGHETVQA